MADDCCSGKNNDKGICPAHGGRCREVAFRTVMHHVKTPWRTSLEPQRYFFCEEPACPVIYFGENGVSFEQAAVREEVGQKRRGPQDMLCYCFDIRYGEAADDAAVKAFVIEQTRAGLCRCDIRNPSGSCCLKDFPE